MESRVGGRLEVLVLVLSLGAAASACAGGDADVAPPNAPAPASAPSVSFSPEAGFLVVPARHATLHGAPIALEAEARLFFNLWPAEEAPAKKPLFVLFNGFSDDVVRSFGTGPRTVAPGGEVVDNAASWTSLGSLLYVEPRQAGFSFDRLPARSRAPNSAACGPDVFNEYVDAADMLLAVLSFVEQHPELGGPVVWVGESYGGARIQWILAALHGHTELAPYVDPLLTSRLDALPEATRARLGAGQILLQPWLLGSAHVDAITAHCVSPTALAAVAASVGAPCPTPDACACAEAAGRSLYHFGTMAKELDQRLFEGDEAHVRVDRLNRLLGVPIADVTELHARADGFVCSQADDQTPPEDELVALFGALPVNQRYYLPYAPLQPGKELGTVAYDWRRQRSLADAFLDNVQTVPTFVTDGPFDLVVPTAALESGLVALLGADHVDGSDPGRLRLFLAAGERSITRRTYPDAGHLVTMRAATALHDDVAEWLATVLPPD
jgi:hypothetical protein